MQIFTIELPAGRAPVTIQAPDFIDALTIASDGLALGTGIWSQTGERSYRFEPSDTSHLLRKPELAYSIKLERSRYILRDGGGQICGSFASYGEAEDAAEELEHERGDADLMARWSREADLY